MQIKYRQAIHALACLAVLQANPGDPDIDLYQLMEMSTRKVLDKNSEVAQFDLELRIEGLKATAEFLRQRVAARESLAATPANLEDANREPVKPVKIFAGVQLDNKSEVARVDPAARTESKEAKAASLPDRLAVEDSLAAITAISEDLHMNQGVLMVIAPSQRLDKNSGVTQFDVELNTSGLNNRADFSQGRLRMHIHRRRRGKPIDEQSPGPYLFRPVRVPMLIRAPLHPTLSG
jgi:hypothetical protein